MPLPAPVKGGSEVKFPTVKDKDLKSAVEELQNQLDNAHETFEQFNDHHAPSVGFDAAQAHLRAVQYLLQTAPKNPHESGMQALRAPWKPSMAEMRKWNNFRNILSHPEEVLQHGLKVPMHPDFRHALETVYPETVDAYRQKLIESTFEKFERQGKSLNSWQRRVVESFLGAKTVINGAELQIIQQASVPAKKESSKGLDGRQKVSQTENMQTQAQRLEGR
jgi:hypothetical protein